MSTEENKAKARRIFEEAFNRGNLAVVDELCAPNYVFHDPTGPVNGPEGFKQYIQMYLTAFPDTHVTIDDIIAEGDLVVTRNTFHGTHRGPLQGVPPTGTRVDVPGMVVTRIVNGKGVESWGVYDGLGMMQQLGVVPAPQSAKAP